MAKFIIIAASLKVPKVLGADINAKRCLELQAEGEEVLIYAVQDMAVVRSVKKLNYLDAIDALEQESAKNGYKTTYPTNFREAGI